jgi:hypothetical protein
MDKKTYPELGTRRIERYVVHNDFKGRRDVIETVAEYTGHWENMPIVYRYAVHWLFDLDALEIDWYDKLPANEEAGRYEKISIPRGLWSKMEGMALSYLITEQTKDALSDAIYITPHANERKVTVTFKKRLWSGYVLIYERAVDGSIILLESRVMLRKTRDPARKGHSRIPRALCELTHDMVYRYFAGLPLHEGRQQTLGLAF